MEIQDVLEQLLQKQNTNVENNADGADEVDLEIVLQRQHFWRWFVPVANDLEGSCTCTSSPSS